MLLRSIKIPNYNLFLLGLIMLLMG